MNDIQIFNNPEFGKIRTIDQNGEPWFVGKDVAQALGYKDTVNALKAHVDEQDKTGWQITTRFGKKEINIINEPGLYSLILSSKMPKAKEFKRWVTSEVLPSIRKHGAYMMPQLSKEMQALFMLDQRTVQQEQRITALENTMTVDYEQQQALKKAVSRVVVEAMGGINSPAYRDRSTSRKVFGECNRDLQDWFRVNSRNNIPRKRFDEAIEYIHRWKPRTNTVMLIQQVNGQTSLFSDQK